MTIKHLYPPKLEEFIKENTCYIPRLIRFDEHLKMYHRYWRISQSEYFKVYQIYDVEGDEYYSVKYMENLTGELSFPIDKNNIYELLYDRRLIGEVPFIINNRISYSGAEIRFWFFIKKIDLDSRRFNGFWSYLDPLSKSAISDDKYYYLFGRDIDGEFRDCKVSLDRIKEQKRLGKEN